MFILISSVENVSIVDIIYNSQINIFEKNKPLLQISSADTVADPGFPGRGQHQGAANVTFRPKFPGN